MKNIQALERNDANWRQSVITQANKLVLWITVWSIPFDINSAYSRQHSPKRTFDAKPKEIYEKATHPDIFWPIIWKAPSCYNFVLSLNENWANLVTRRQVQPRWACSEPTASASAQGSELSGVCENRQQPCSRWTDADPSIDCQATSTTWRTGEDHATQPIWWCFGTPRRGWSRDGAVLESAQKATRDMFR